MRRALASGTLVGFSLTAVLALAQGTTPPAAPAPTSAPPATPPATGTAAPAAPTAAPSATPAPSAAPAPPAAPSAAPPAPTAAPSAAPPAEPAPPPVGAAPAAAAPASPVAVGTPSTSGESPPAEKPVDRGVEPKRSTTKPDPWQDAHALGVEGFIYASGRIGPSNIDASDEERFGVGFDLSAWLTLSKEYVLGLGLTYADLGSARTSSGVNEFTGQYDVLAPYLGVRAFPWRRPGGEIFIGLRLGIAWQSVQANGIRSPPDVWEPDPFECSGFAGPGVALGAGIGGALRLGSRSWFTGHLDANGYNLTSDVIDDCAVGIGSVTNATLGAGFLYAFDLGADAALDSEARLPAHTW